MVAALYLVYFPAGMQTGLDLLQHVLFLTAHVFV